MYNLLQITVKLQDGRFAARSVVERNFARSQSIKQRSHHSSHLISPELNSVYGP